MTSYEDMPVSRAEGSRNAPHRLVRPGDRRRFLAGARLHVLPQHAKTVAEVVIIGVFAAATWRSAGRCAAGAGRALAADRPVRRPRPGGGERAMIGILARTCPPGEKLTECRGLPGYSQACSPVPASPPGAFSPSAHPGTCYEWAAQLASPSWWTPWRVTDLA